jgi:hypothetical protein
MFLPLESRLRVSGGWEFGDSKSLKFRIFGFEFRSFDFRNAVRSIQKRHARHSHSALRLSPWVNSLRISHCPLAKGVDVRSTGSGSTGATNVMRNLGIIGFVATFILDVGKGILAVLLASRLTSGDPRWIALSSVAAILGHCFPVWLKFRGGKGVATGVGVFIALAPLQVGAGAC